MGKTELQSKEKQQLAIERKRIQCLPKDPFLWEQGKKHYFSDRKKFWIPCSLQMPERATVALSVFIEKLLHWDMQEEADGLGVPSVAAVWGAPVHEADRRG